jgi:hypothetical protein
MNGSLLIASQVLGNVIRLRVFYFAEAGGFRAVTYLSIRMRDSRSGNTSPSHVLPTNAIGSVLVLP